MAYGPNHVSRRRIGGCQVGMERRQGGEVGWLLCQSIKCKEETKLDRVMCGRVRAGLNHAAPVFKVCSLRPDSHAHH